MILPQKDILAGVARGSVGADFFRYTSYHKHRTAVERVNSRPDVSFGFELHTIRGLQKMQMRSGLALVVMLAMAVGRIRQQHPDLMRSLVRSA